LLRLQPRLVSSYLPAKSLRDEPIVNELLRQWKELIHELETIKESVAEADLEVRQTTA